MEQALSLQPKEKRVQPFGEQPLIIETDPTLTPPA